MINRGRSGHARRPRRVLAQSPVTMQPVAGHDDAPPQFAQGGISAAFSRTPEHAEVLKFRCRPADEKLPSISAQKTT